MPPKADRYLPIILRKALQQAIDSGYDTAGLSANDIVDTLMVNYGTTGISGVFGIIFNQDFAKALWGEKPCEVNGDDRLFSAPIWQYHLQQMVIDPDPIEYLGRNI